MPRKPMSDSKEISSRKKLVKEKEPVSEGKRNGEIFSFIHLFDNYFLKA